MTPDRETLAAEVERLEDALTRVEWVRNGTGKGYHCHFCGGVSIRDGGDDHADDCEWVRLTRGDISKQVAEQVQEIARLREALSGLVGTSEREWRPIATAPKDETAMVLLGGVFVHTGRWYADVGSWFNSPGYWDWSADDSQPTHWMPLPAPPVEQGEEQ